MLKIRQKKFHPNFIHPEFIPLQQEILLSHVEWMKNRPHGSHSVRHPCSLCYHPYSISLHHSPFLSILCFSPVSVHTPSTSIFSHFLAIRSAGWSPASRCFSFPVNFLSQTDLAQLPPIHLCPSSVYKPVLTVTRTSVCNQLKHQSSPLNPLHLSSKFSLCTHFQTPLLQPSKIPRHPSSYMRVQHIS